MDFQQKLANYAKLIVTHGMNVQPGQVVSIKGEIYHREFLFLIAKESYAAGGKYVQVEYLEPRLQKVRHKVSKEEDLKYIPAYLSHRYSEMVENASAMASIVGQESPDILSDIDPARINASRMAWYNAARKLYEEGIGKSKVHWTVAAAATPGWAAKIFPDRKPSEAEQCLWEQLFRICRVDREDFLEAWKEHNTTLHTRAKRLTELGIETIHFVGPGTDLRVGLSEKALFKGGTDVGPHGEPFEPNIPTEECFSTPDWRKSEGNVTATRPFYLNGKLIKGLRMSFHDGEITKFSAEEGEPTFREYIGSDEGAKRLGEVALVGIDSPIFQSGLVFEDTLLDENAACHIAIGSAYKFCLEDGDTLSKDDLSAIGCNESSVHSDIMISSSEVDVAAVTRSGETVPLLKNGSWVLT